ncbi:hypothetical protein L1D61_26910 [Vibrio mediterranei]|uniref:Uncharacterized protein n=1 Tax=Vibrio mediterranei TaxID=689 RepID=A0A3G4VJM7_9VIBR|nr:hypothetical protein [Vibrio mediterranei]AYV24970.1 hypothetical protein ECB94_26990 [Vibrio mediterranei]MCG9790748.1 hypothetical protein [Vibrio mediterranei]
MKMPTLFTAISELTARDFRKQAVITPKHKFDVYDDDGVQKCNVINWSVEYQTHVYQKLDIATVDGKPLYFVETHCALGQAWLCSESFKTIKEVKAHLKSNA